MQLIQKSSFSSALGLFKRKASDWTTINPRHIFRALLRECTYLPDSASRLYFRHYIIHRFRKYNPRLPVPIDFTERLQQLPAQKDLLKNARKALVLLQRANAGRFPQLKKVLSMTYGRIGKRKRELLHELSCRTLLGEEALSPLVSPTHLVDKGPALGKQLQALAMSQGLHMPSDNIPTRNSWGRPMPLKRVRNLKAKWYADVLNRIAPPLPNQEWERLRDLASGRIQWEGPVQPRKRAATTASDCIDDQACVNLSASLGISLGQDHMLSFKPNCGNGSRTLSHTLTTRFMKRIWRKTFTECSTMTWDAARDKWKVKHVKWEKFKPNTIRPAEPLELSMFEGVDVKGKII